MKLKIVASVLINPSTAKDSAKNFNCFCKCPQRQCVSAVQWAPGVQREREQWDFFFGTIKRMRTFASQYYAREELLWRGGVSLLHVCAPAYTHSRRQSAHHHRTSAHIYMYKQLSRAQPAAARRTYTSTPSEYNTPLATRTPWRCRVYWERSERQLCMCRLQMISCFLACDVNEKNMTQANSIFPCVMLEPSRELLLLQLFSVAFSRVLYSERERERMSLKNELCPGFDGFLGSAQAQTFNCICNYTLAGLGWWSLCVRGNPADGTEYFGLFCHKTGGYCPKSQSNYRSKM